MKIQYVAEIMYTANVQVMACLLLPSKGPLSTSHNVRTLLLPLKKEDRINPLHRAKADDIALHYAGRTGVGGRSRDESYVSALSFCPSLHCCAQLRTDCVADVHFRAT